MRRSFVTAALSGLIALIGFGAAAGDFATKVTNDFWEDEITWDGGFGKAYEFRWSVFAQDGQYVVCGAGKFLDATTRSNTIDLLRKGKVVLNGRTILTDLTFFPKVKARQELVGASATCRQTGVKPRKGDDEVHLEISGRGRF